VDTDDPRAVALNDALGTEVKEMYGEVGDSPGASPLGQRFGPKDVLLLAFENDELIGLGGMRCLDAATAEVKRMYVCPEHRGRGVGRELLEALEDRASEMGCTAVRLDTGNRQAQAIGLYLAAGYTDIDAYSSNRWAERWFEKRLDR
jgi:GNAT superfamily N-acetyltransferase